MSRELSDNPHCSPTSFTLARIAVVRPQRGASLSPTTTTAVCTCTAPSLSHAPGSVLGPRPPTHEAISP